MGQASTDLSNPQGHRRVDDPNCRRCQRTLVHGFHDLLRYAPNSSIHRAEELCLSCVAETRRLARLRWRKRVTWMRFLAPR
ncbi:hypothetical protein [Arhodomonas sp. SL1]|uniref:hypothetical protein n=1 Tax=Arhodomonas sp. SL1 TaxID=3425691 RepID=UPI003F880E86